MKRIDRIVQISRAAGFLAVASAITFLTPVQAQTGPSIVSVTPHNGATGVSSNATVTFTFSAAMDMQQTAAMFFSGTGTLPAPAAAWNSGGTILTCTPSSPWPSPATISWFVEGQDTSGNAITGIPSGGFTTGAGTSCPQVAPTNSTFQVGYIWFYQQNAAGPPALGGSSPDPYIVSASVTLASNVNASAVNLMLPGGAVSNLYDNLGSPPLFETGTESGDLNALEGVWSNGNYTFNVQGASPSGALPAQATVAFNLAQPNAPQVENFAAAQAVNPSQGFTLEWNAFANATAQDVIFVSIGYSACPVKMGFEASLQGTATSVTIPANTLEPSTTYGTMSSNSASIVFVKKVVTTHANPAYDEVASRESLTFFSLITTAGSTNNPPPSTNLPSITKQPANVAVIARAPATVAVTAKGTGTLTYQWQFNGANLANSANVTGATTAILKIKSAQASDAGSYSVIVTDPSGSTTSATAILTVATPPSITTQPKSEVVASNANTSFSVVAAGTSPLTYHWKRNGATLSDTATYSGTATPTLTITAARSVNTGIYTVTVGNAVGSVTSAKATLTVDAPPSITTEPTNRVVKAGATATFSVKATGTAPLSYHWLENGTNLVNGGGVSGATTPTLIIAKAEVVNEATYSVAVSNLVGSVTSSNATLTVTP